MTPQMSQRKVVRATGKGKPIPATTNEKTQPVDWVAFLERISRGKTLLELGAGRSIYHQGDPADSIFYIRRGKVKRTVASQQGKEAIVGILGDDEFFGEGCLAGQPLRISTAIAVSDCTLYRIEKPLMMRVLHEQHEVSEFFITHLLSRNIRFEEDLVDQLFNSSEKRLARILLLLAHFGKEGRTENCPPRNQSGAPGPNGRYHPVASQSFHEQVPHAGLYRLHGRRRVDGKQWPLERDLERLASCNRHPH
jgi:CRP/FNR family transcriptional regulator, cyclic AMP receptor protein